MRLVTFKIQFSLRRMFLLYIFLNNIIVLKDSRASIVWMYSNRSRQLCLETLPLWIFLAVRFNMLLYTFYFNVRFWLKVKLESCLIGNYIESSYICVEQCWNLYFRTFYLSYLSEESTQYEVEITKLNDQIRNDKEKYQDKTEDLQVKLESQQTEIDELKTK